ncbi:SGNH/GDSL hydrolase family protein [Novosphingobium sp. ERN07]|uniref:SGNH/GDSL hydrolase family protein n=1 Tax=Novosphingobium sp. ERN07 TaxID=2726187 RepID=UPI0014571530|nr:SGNH/GDSL hydrolase family protein [Novosphingobium sp. ERN07]NLR70568.1 SGNH/GDSL hydrolase family protein [Novosphingobium sp. ERN07]
MLTIRCACIALACGTLPLAWGAASAQPAWREAYQSSPATYEAPSEEFIKFANQHWNVPAEKLRSDLTPQPVSGTIRYRVTLQASGSQIRVRFSNEEVAIPLRIGAASVALSAGAYAAKPDSLVALTFGGAKAVTVPAGAPFLSDPVTLPVKSGTELLVSIALASPIMNEGRGGAGFSVGAGDQAMQAVLDRPSALNGRPLVTGVSVLSDKPPRVIVAFGDSITDGNRVNPGALHGWPEVLAQRLAARTGGQRYTVVNAGIAGNRVLASGWGAAALSRLDRDALRIDGISHLILLEGVNDINFSGKSPFGTNPEITSDDLINGYRQIIARCHDRGVKVYLGTLTPNPGDAATSTAAKRALRDDVNRWMRTSGEPDGVIDFDAIVRDPAAPSQFAPAFDSGDHLHPSDAGHMAMGQGIDLALFP